MTQTHRCQSQISRCIGIKRQELGSGDHLHHSSAIVASTLIGTRLTNCSPARSMADSSFAAVSSASRGVAFDDDLVVDNIHELARVVPRMSSCRSRKARLRMSADVPWMGMFLA